MSQAAGHRGSSDPALLWLWCRPAAAVPIRLLTQELPYAAYATIKRKKKNLSLVLNVPDFGMYLSAVLQRL